MDPASPATTPRNRGGRPTRRPSLESPAPPATARFTSIPDHLMSRPRSRGSRPVLWPLAAASLLAGCAARSEIDTRTAGGDVAPAQRWTARLTAPGTSTLSGSVVLAPSSGERQSVAVISLSDGRMSPTTLAWRLVQGGCGSAGAPIGNPGDYPPIQLRADGTGHSTATLAMAIPTSGSYSVRVHPSPAETGTVLACAELRREEP